VLPAQNSSGNWVKVVQRIPVRIAIERQPRFTPCAPGMSVYVYVDTGHRRSPRRPVSSQSIAMTCNFLRNTRL